jgi:hypothetical protein
MVERFEQVTAWQKKKLFKGAAKEGIVAEEISTIKKKPSVLQWDTRMMY